MTFRQFAFNNVKRNIRVYLAYFLSSVFTIIVFFSFATNLFHPVIASQKGGAIEEIMGLAEGAIFVFAFFFILISVNAFLKIRQKEFGVLTILGMSKKQFNRMIFLENMLIGCVAILTGITIGLVFSKLLLMVTAHILSFEALSFYFPIQAALLTIAFFLIIFIGISTIAPKIIRTNDVVQLLKGAQKDNKEITFSKTLSFVSVLCLFLGYFMSVSSKIYGLHPFLNKIILFVENLPFREVILIALIAVGTYLFFTQLSIFVLHRLRKNKSYYMRKTNMLWISELFSRIRDNARMLFLVTMISTAAYVAITSVYALNSVVKDEALKDNPFALTYTSIGDNANEVQNIKAIDDMLTSSGVAYKTYKTEVIKQVSSSGYSVHIIRVSEYNTRAAALGLAQVSIDESQALLVPADVRYDPVRDKTLNQKNIPLDDGKINLTVKEVAPQVIVYSGLFRNLIAVNDSTYDKISDMNERYVSYSYEIPDWLNTRNAMKSLRSTLGDGEYGSSFWSNRIEIYDLENQTKKLFLYAGFFLGAIFFMGASSFLYFRLYTDLNRDKSKYLAISKLGLTFKELKKVASRQISVLFFVPYLLAAIHTSFATALLQSMLYTSVWQYFLVVMAVFLILEVIYYSVVRSRYIKYLAQYTV
ncbi:protein of unknown function DUF214 [Syntrophobotulus glycolicus DSM 8271]|uniref:ABC3 transporter permease C-terminal domain-containing protein n=1 Tax=Syntrophobotulus glycolicus (strain DSM 8271 / FlGlyR) TaxID=645991 RepID=F0SU89_SYNGF|nr:ABC transporter permease [Syntrophobotulus glycolicus]ADY55472.1 protein of unknown function DUF214 [Syntrophobotulus glycolicus DSM 8271]